MAHTQRHTQNFLGVFAPLESTHIHIEQNRCVQVRNKNADCLKCAQACTSGAISLTDGSLRVAAEKCVGCGTCATVCPTCALEMLRPSDQELFEACVTAGKSAGDVVHIACREAAEVIGDEASASTPVCVICLGRIDESLLVLLARAGITQVKLVCGTCEACSLRVGIHTARLVCEQANNLLEVFGREAFVGLEEAAPTHTSATPAQTPGAPNVSGLSSAPHMSNASGASNLPDASNNSNLPDESTSSNLSETPSVPRTSNLPTLTGASEAGKFTKVQDDGTLAHHLPKRRARLQQALTDLGQPHASKLQTRLWGSLSIDLDACWSCTMCATFCPTEAIHKFSEADGTFGLIHYPYRCVQCHCCEDICPASALRVSDTVQTQDLLERGSKRFYMQEPKAALGPHQMQTSLSNLLGTTQIFER